MTAPLFGACFTFRPCFIATGRALMTVMGMGGFLVLASSPPSNIYPQLPLMGTYMIDVLLCPRPGASTAARSTAVLTSTISAKVQQHICKMVVLKILLINPSSSPSSASADS